MKKNSIKFLALLLAVFLTFGLLAGCGGTGRQYHI